MANVARKEHNSSARASKYESKIPRVYKRTALFNFCALFGYECPDLFFYISIADHRTYYYAGACDNCGTCIQESYQSLLQKESTKKDNTSLSRFMNLRFFSLQLWTPDNILLHSGIVTRDTNLKHGCLLLDLKITYLSCNRSLILVAW